MYARWSDIRSGVCEQERRINTMQVRVGTIDAVERWIRAHGGAVAGLHAVNSGPLDERGIWIGRLHGGIEFAGLGTWVVRTGQGDFVIHEEMDAAAG
jgi:hypothetical protein